MAQHDMDTAELEDAYWEAKAEAAEATGEPVSAEELADLFGVTDLDEISDGLYEEYLAFEGQRRTTGCSACALCGPDHGGRCFQ